MKVMKQMHRVIIAMRKYKMSLNTAIPNLWNYFKWKYWKPLCNSRPLNSFGTESDRTYLYTVQSAHHISWGSLSDMRSVHYVLVTAQCTQRVNLLFQISENKWKTSRYKWQDHTFLSVSNPEFGMTELDFSVVLTH